MCFSLAWLMNLLIWIVIICAVVALIRLLISFVHPPGIAGPILSFVVQALWIVFWAIICIAAIYFIFELISCLWPLLPRLGRV